MNDLSADNNIARGDYPLCLDMPDSHIFPFDQALVSADQALLDYYIAFSNYLRILDTASYLHIFPAVNREACFYIAFDYQRFGIPDISRREVHIAVNKI